MSFDLESYRIDRENFAKNTSTRVPICLLIDTSLSMKLDKRMESINKGVNKFISDMKKDIYASTSVELCIITFGEEVQVALPFTEIGKAVYSPVTPNGKTPLGEAAILAIDVVTDLLKKYDNTGVTSFKPWIIIFSDGKANDNSYLLPAKKLRKYEAEQHWKIMTIGIGNEENSLASFTSQERVCSLKEIEIASFFDWISHSVSNISKSRPEIYGYEEDEMKFKGQLL